MVGFIADGQDEVRRAAREQLRRDVDQIKIMASGGAMSPSDELDTTQFTVAEMRAAVEEAQAVGKYVLSHAYSDTAVRKAIEAGVRSIEHGNLIRETAAQGHQGRRTRSWCRRWSPTRPSIARASATASATTRSPKIDMARQQSIQGLTYAYKAGCKIGSGSDLLGDMATQRAVEFELKAPGDEADGGAAVGDQGQRRAVPHVAQDRQRGAQQVRRPDRASRATR